MVSCSPSFNHSYLLMDFPCMYIPFDDRRTAISESFVGESYMDSLSAPDPKELLLKTSSSTPSSIPTCPTPSSPFQPYESKTTHLTLPLLPLPTPTPLRNPQHKINNHGRQQCHRQHRRPQPIIKPALPPHPYTLRPPMERKQRVDHRRHRHDRETRGGDPAHAVAEVE